MTNDQEKIEELRKKYEEHPYDALLQEAINFGRESGVKETDDKWIKVLGEIKLKKFDF